MGGFKSLAQWAAPKLAFIWVVRPLDFSENTLSVTSGASNIRNMSMDFVVFSVYSQWFMAHEGFSGMVFMMIGSTLVFICLLFSQNRT